MLDAAHGEGEHAPLVVRRVDAFRVAIEPGSVDGGGVERGG